MTSLTFYGGAGEIGGNKFLLEDEGVKIYLDFGQGFDFGEDFFYEYLTPRKVNGLEVYFEFNLLPKITKLYNKQMLEFTDLKYQKPNIDAIFLSHSHADHVSHLPFVDEKIPVYLGHGTKRIMEIYEKLFPGFSKLGEHDYHLFKSGDKIKIKHLTIEPIHVEHSVPGAYGFIIRTSKGNVVYTGDLRIHGLQACMTEEFIKKCQKAKPKVLLIEGTRIDKDPEHDYTEKEVEEKAAEIIKQSKGTVFASFAMTNIGRFRSFYQAAKNNKRILVVDTRLAYVLDNLQDKLNLPDVMKDKNIKVYYRLSKSRKFEEKDYFPWERRYLPNRINYEEIKKHPKKYVMFLGFYKLMELIYLQPKDADFIYSQSEHFLEGEDNEDMRTVFENWMSHFKINFHKTHCSGHASREDLFEMIKQIKPEIVIPIHTFNPEKFKEAHTNIILVKKGKKIEIK